MAEPTWAQILRVMYEEDLEGEAVGLRMKFSHQDVAEAFGKELNENPAKVRKTMSYMDNIGLIDGWSKEEAEKGGFVVGDNVSLTEKGFDVIHERELTKRRDRTNTTLVGFTLALVLATLVAALPATWPFLGYELNLRLVGAFVLLEVVVWYILRTDLHKDLLDL